MNTKNEAVSNTAIAATAASHSDTAQERITEIRAMREAIPKFIVPDSPKARQRLAIAASVPPEFVELAAVTLKNSTDVAAGKADPAEMRDLMTYAGAYDPVADELEALAHFLRHSTTAARNKAGRTALMVYSLAKRLAKAPENADLAPFVADMERALGFRERAAKAKVTRRKAEGAATQPPPVVTTPPKA
jgi:hypothetical protein